MTDEVFRLLVTGSRAWTGRQRLRDTLDRWLAAHPGLILVHGDARHGADQLAREWAEDRQVPQERHPAEWRRHGSSCPSSCRDANYCKRAGLRRNLEMVAAGADQVIAFTVPCGRTRGWCVRLGPHDSHGAGQCADAADAAGLPVLRLTGGDGGHAGTGDVVQPAAPAAGGDAGDTVVAAEGVAGLPGLHR